MSKITGAVEPLRRPARLLPRRIPVVFMGVILGAAVNAAVPAAAAGARSDLAFGGPAKDLVPSTSIRFTSPAASDVVYGPTIIRVEVIAPAGSEPIRVDFYADGRLLSSDPRPPYEARWDPGTDMTSHILRAVARFADGKAAEDRITTRGLRFESRDVVEGVPIERVELLVSVTDRSGAPVTGLRMEDFDVREAGSPVAIKEFRLLREVINTPLSVAVLVDRSGSMARQMSKWRQASLELLGAMRTIDQIRVSAFSFETVVLQDFTRDAFALAMSLNQIGPASGGTSLFKAVFETVRDMRDLPGRKALILLTDGLDTDYTSPSSPVFASFYTLLEETVRMASRAGVTIVLILPGPSGRGYLAVQDLALQTGGWWMYSGEDLGATLRRLGKRLLSSYILAYDVPQPPDADRKRPVSVALKEDRGGEWTLRASLGAYARLGTLEALKDDFQAGNAAQRERAATELGRLESEAIGPLLIKALDDKAPGVRGAVIAALGERREPGALEKVLKAIHDENDVVREKAYEAAVRYGAAAVPALVEQARGRGAARAPALRALGAIGDPGGQAAIEEALDARDCVVRTAGADAAGMMVALGGIASSAPQSERREAPSSLVGGLRRTLDAPCEDASEAAALGLARLGDPLARPRLVAMARASIPSPRLSEALLALRTYPSPEILAAVESRLSEAEPVGGAARAAAADLYAQAAASAADAAGREAALKKVVDLGGPEAASALERLLTMERARRADAAWQAAIEEALRKVRKAAEPAAAP